jgi:uncharacterized protein (TIGR02231 family)
MTNLPVSRVVVLEDRAQVERRGAVSLPGGLTRLEIPGVSLVAVDRSLKVEVQGATLVDARLVRRWRELSPGGLPAEASELRRAVQAREQRVEVLGDGARRLSLEGELLSSARAELLRAISEFTAEGKADGPAWAEQLRALSERQAAWDGRRLEHGALEAAARQELAQARAALGAAEQPVSNLECLLALSLEGSGPAQVKVSYLVPCALWRPAYRATLAGGRVRVEAEAVVWQRTGEDWRQVALSFSTARPTLGTTPPSLEADLLGTRPKQEQEKRVVSVSVREEVIQTAGEGGGAAELPGLDDGGEARLLEPQGRFDVPSDGLPHRVAVSSFDAAAEVERVCAAELSGLVSLVAKAANTSGQVLLAGPVDLLRESGFVGRSTLSFTGAGEFFKLSFGSDDGLRVLRSVQEKTEEARLTGRRTTRRTVTLHVSNANREPAALVLEERVPVSEVKEVDVQVVAKECSPAPSPVSKDGLTRLALELPANGTRKATFVWQLSAGARVAGL